MTWPTAANKTHLDEATDDPKQARSELATLVDKFNEMRTHVSSFMQTFLSRTTAAAARSDLGAVNIAGDTMTGALTFDLSSSNPLEFKRTGDGIDAAAPRLAIGADGVVRLDLSGQGTSRINEFEISGRPSNGSGLTDVSKFIVRKGGATHEVYSRFDIASQAEAEAGADNDAVMTPLRTQQAIDNAQVGATSVLKTADETLSGNSTLQDDDHLVFAMEANKTYGFRLMLIRTAGGTGGDFKIGWSLPTGTTMFWGLHGGGAESTEHWNVAGTDSAVGDALLTESDTLTIAASSTDTLGVIVEGIVRNGANAGDFQFQWAQNSSAPADCTIKEGSNMVVRELGAT